MSALYPLIKKTPCEDYSTLHYQKIVNIISQRIERKYNGCNLEGRAYCKVNGNGPQRAPRPSVTEQDTRTLLIRVPQAQDSKKAKASDAHTGGFSSGSPCGTCQILRA